MTSTLNDRLEQPSIAELIARLVVQIEQFKAEFARAAAAAKRLK